MNKARKVSVVSTKVGIVVKGVSAANLRKAIRLLEKQPDRAEKRETKLAAKFYQMSKKFFESGGRFKRPYKKRKSRPTPATRGKAK